MTGRYILATENGVVICEKHNGQWLETHQSLMNKMSTAIIAREGVILAGTTEGVYRSEDWGETWQAVNQGLTLPHIRWLAYHPEISGAEFAGTEPAGIFVSRNGGDSWQSCPEVGQLRDEHGWFLPYSPEAGCARGFAFHGQRAYAAIEVGGVLRSDDGGGSWQLVAGCTGDPSFSKPTPPGFVHTDVHSIEVHPTSPDIVFAATNSGLYRSINGGTTWDNLYPHHYCRAVWIDPHNVNHIILGPANSVDQQGRIETTSDGGQTWQLASAGLDAPWPQSMVERFTQVDDTLLAVLSNGRLFEADLHTLWWQRILAEAPKIKAVTTMPNDIN